MEKLLIILITLAVFVAFLAWVFSLIEWLGILVVAGWPFRVGPVVLRGIFNIAPPMPGRLDDAFLDLRHVKGRILENGRIIFRSKFSFFGFHSPLQIKGTVILEGGKAHVVGRLPVGPIVFVACFLFCWTGASVLVLIKNVALNPFIFLGFGWATVVAFSLIAWPLERIRFQRAFFQIRESISPESGSFDAQ